MALSNLIWWPWHGFQGGGGPVAAEYRPVGDNPQARAAREAEARRSRRRLEQDEEEILFILSQL